jgi:hypothetical protein
LIEFLFGATIVVGLLRSIYIPLYCRSWFREHDCVIAMPRITSQAGENRKAVCKVHKHDGMKFRRAVIGPKRILEVPTMFLGSLARIPV